MWNNLWPLYSWSYNCRNSRSFLFNRMLLFDAGFCLLGYFLLFDRLHNLWFWSWFRRFYYFVRRKMNINLTIRPIPSACFRAFDAFPIITMVTLRACFFFGWANNLFINPHQSRFVELSWRRRLYTLRTIPDLILRTGNAGISRSHRPGRALWCSLFIH